MAWSATGSVTRSPSDSPKADHKPGFRTDIEGLRAVAVLLVIAYHAGFAPRQGFLGVDVFFVISGYLITGLLLRELATTGTISWARFRASDEQERFAVAIRAAIASGIQPRPELGACPITLAQPTGIGRTTFSSPNCLAIDFPSALTHSTGAASFF